MDNLAVMLLSIALGIATLLLLVHIRQSRRLKKELMRTLPMQTALRARDELLLSVYKISQDAIFAIDAHTGMLLDANRIAQELLGYTPGELRQMHHTGLYPAERIAAAHGWRKTEPSPISSTTRSQTSR